MSIWKLPHGISDLSISGSDKFANIRGNLLNLYKTFGYRFVYPPIVEYEKSLFTSEENSITDFKTIDPNDGKLLVIRSDITPQIARLDAKYSTVNDISRYCYVSGILKTISDDFYSSRNPIQTGVELYGSTNGKADLEVIEIMLNSLELLGFDNNILLNIGNIAIFNTLIAKLSLTNDEVGQIKDIFIRKSKTELFAFIDNYKDNNNLTDAKIIDDVIYLFNLAGDVSILTAAKNYYKHINSIVKIIDKIIILAQKLATKKITLYFDLADLRAQPYYTGLLFSCFNKNHHKAIAQGGRYDNLSAKFDISRAAVGFSLDLKYIIDNNNQVSDYSQLFAPNIVDEDLAIFIAKLRNDGITVVNNIDGKENNSFIKVNNKWQIKE